MLWNGNKHGKTMAVRILKQPSPYDIMTDQKQLKNVEYFNYSGGLIINDAICRCEIESMIAMAKTKSNNKKKNVFPNELELKLTKNLVKHYIWSLT
jgi:hypothetical protein